MKHIVIELTNEQHEVIKTEISKQMLANFENEVQTGLEITLTCIEGFLSSLELKLQEVTEIGDVTWSMG
ncbi:hypothetical protein JCM19314_3734 [Nonlabens ulvanivorans]|uniref:Uncharacterized protein n=1 Tax=Nonlabens ulvanivorans TaxID=906888 RepID=A0A090Q9C8_NONUL|nr:hypothetical protein [Nonlabens ulvanivorans]GAK99689.1 hypothetical protein JCM19314_3734 [Nonlabens ulvanivorans]